MAPELFSLPTAGGRPVRPNYRTDVYAWGVLAWQVLVLCVFVLLVTSTVCCMRLSFFLLPYFGKFNLI